MTAARFAVTPALLEARRLIRAGRIGRLAYITSNLSRKLDASASWRGDRSVAGGGVWMEHGPDLLDVVETLAGPLRRIRMTEERLEQGTAVEDEVRIEAEHVHGGLSRLHLSWNAQGTGPIARCVGTEGELIIGAAQTVLRSDQGDTTVAAGYDEREALHALLEGFLRRRAKPSGADHGARAVSWIHAAYESLRSARWEIA